MSIRTTSSRLFISIVIFVIAAERSHAVEESALNRKPIVTTHVYKKVGKLEVKLDIYRPDDKMRPRAVVWIHGGALIMGHRQGIDWRVARRLLADGYAIISIDYRLAPETKLPQIIEDIEDAFRWIHANGASRLNVDTSRLAVIGGSAGGYLTLVTGYRVKPRPAVLVSFYGYGDLIGDWYSQPSKHPRHHRSKMLPDEALRQVDGPAISDSRQRPGNGGVFYQFCRQHGTWPLHVSGWNPHTEAQKYEPYMPVRNVTKDYPPTLLIHGTQDTDVPYEQSVMMAKEFDKHGVAHDLITITDGEHGLGGGDPQRITEAYELVPKFISQFIKP